MRDLHVSEITPMPVLTEHPTAEQVVASLNPYTASQFLADPQRTCQLIYSGTQPGNGFDHTRIDMLAFALSWTEHVTTVVPPLTLRPEITVFQILRISPDGDQHVTHWASLIGYTPEQAAAVTPLLIDDHLPEWRMERKL